MGKRSHGLCLDRDDASFNQDRSPKAARRYSVVSNPTVIPNDEDIGKCAMAEIAKKGQMDVKSIPSAAVVVKPVKLGVIPSLLLDEMQSERSETVYKAVCRLGKLCANEPTLRVDAVQQGAHALLVVAMKNRWHQNEPIVAECCKCLYLLMAPISEHTSNHMLRIALLCMGASTVITKTIHDFPNSSSVAYYGFCALRRLFSRCDERTKHAVEQFCVAEGGLSVTTGAMTKFSRIKSLQYECCRLLTRLCGDFVTAKQFVLDSGAVEMVESATRGFPKTRWIQRQGKEFFKLACVDSVAKDEEAAKPLSIYGPC